MTGIDRFTEPDTDPDWTDSKIVVYSAIADHEELIDVLDTADYNLHPHFDTPAEAHAFGDLVGKRDVVRITIETEW